MATDFYKVRNRETLKRLDSGMEIVRAIKHEPIDFNSLSREELRSRTDDRNGSKFFPDWRLPELVTWLEDHVRREGWRFPPGVQARVRVLMDREIGYVQGQPVKTITIMASGRWVHAFPDND